MNSEHWPCFAPCPFLQLDSVAGVPARGAAVQLQEEVGEGEVEMEVETCLPPLPHHPHILQGRLASGKQQLVPVQSPSIYLPGRPLPKPELNDDAGEHQDDGLRGHLGVPPPALPSALHHLLEVGHHALAPAGGLLVGTGVRDPLLFRLSPSLPLCSWCLWVRLKILFSR